MKRFWIPLIVYALVLTGCGGSPDAAAPVLNSDPPANAAVSGENEPAQGSAHDSSASENTPVPPSDDPTGDSGDPSQVPDVVHGEFPGEFKLAPLQIISDCITGRYFIPGQEFEFNIACDKWEWNFFERPVEEGGAGFFPQLDIVESSFGQDENWFYNRILLFSELVEDLVLDGVYALELDLDLDARGNFLIVAVSPGSYAPDEWYSNGVQVWIDSNDDVGGPTAVLVDPRYDGNGYETLLVSSGMGDDPDLAYVKTSSEEPGLVDFGFKISLLNGADRFEWWVWAMQEDLGAAKYDPVDFFPQDSLFAIDNTCGWISGSYHRDLPNICELTLGPKPTSKPGSSSPSCPASVAQKKKYCPGNGGDWFGYPTCDCVIN